MKRTPVKSSRRKLAQSSFSEKKFKVEREFAAGPSRGIPLGLVNEEEKAPPVVVPALSEVVTKKNFNKMVLESRILDGKWKLSESDIVAIIRRETRFKLVLEEKLKGYKGQAFHRLVASLKLNHAKQEDEFAIEQRRRESKWKPDAENLCLSKETFQLQPLLDHGNVEGYAIETVHAGGSADIVLTKASTTREYPLSWSEKLLLPVFLPIKASVHSLVPWVVTNVDIVSII